MYNKFRKCIVAAHNALSRSCCKWGGHWAQLCKSDYCKTLNFGCP